nr:type II toxin-antitoxin system HipA family toxin [Prevotella sp.]
MENNVLTVMLWGMEVGKIYWNTKLSNSVFTFNKTFINKGLDISPIQAPINNPMMSQGIPINGNKNKLYSGLPEFISDSMPDHWGNKVFAKWLEEKHLKSKQINPVDRLAFIGKRGMGALEFQPAYLTEDPSTNVDIEALYHLSDKIFHDRENLSLNIKDGLVLDDMYKIGTSAGGRRPKAIIGINESTGEIRSGQASLPPEFDYYIIKFSDSNTNGFPFSKIEMAYYLMAKDSGIEMMPSKLVEIDGTQNFMTKRFDRCNGNKIHTQTLAAMNSMADTYEDLFIIGRKIRLNIAEQTQQFRRLVFNVLASNIDDHTKNFSFMMSPDGKWHITPAYDLIFSVDLDAPSYINNHCISINGKTSDITRNDLLSFAAGQDIKDAANIIDSISEKVVNFKKYAEQCNISKGWILRIENYLKENEILKGKWVENKQETAYNELYICSNGMSAKDIRFVKLKNKGFRLYANINGGIYQYNFSISNTFSSKISNGKISVDERNELIEKYLLPKAIKDNEKTNKI